MSECKTRLLIDSAVGYEYMVTFLLLEELKYLEVREKVITAKDYLSTCPDILGALLDLYLFILSKETESMENISFEFSMNLRASVLKRRLQENHVEIQAIGMLLKPSFAHIAFNQVLDIAGAKRIAEAISENSTLQEINLSGNRMLAEGVESIADGIRMNSTLLKIDLGENSRHTIHVGAKAAKYLAEAIERNSTLQEIRLHKNDIGPEGARAIAKLIKLNSTLQVIDISTNNIRDKGAEEIADAIKDNSTLLEINLSSNSIEDKGAKLVADAIKSNSVLQVIRLNKNKIENEGAKSIYEAIKDNKNTALHEIHFSENKFRPIYTSKVVDELTKRKRRKVESN